MNSEEEVLHLLVYSSYIEMGIGLNCMLRIRWESVVAVSREVAGARNDSIDRMDRALKLRLVAERRWALSSVAVEIVVVTEVEVSQHCWHRCS